MSHPELQRYQARLDELKALAPRLGERMADPAPVVGRVLEAAGDLLRRSTALGGASPAIDPVLRGVPAFAVDAWLRGVDAQGLAAVLARGAERAMEAAIPDPDDDAETLAGIALDALRSRDRLESVLVALARVPAQAALARLTAIVAQVDVEGRRHVRCFTALNDARRREARLLDETHRARAWWFTERSGPEDDQLLKVLGGVTGGTTPVTEQASSRVVEQKRNRPATFDELFRFDLGLATPAERAAIRRQAERDEGMQQVLAALEEGERAIEELEDDVPPPTRLVPGGRPVEPRDEAPQIVLDRPECQVLVFRSPRRVQVVVQPLHRERLAAAAVALPDEPGSRQEAAPGPLGLFVDLAAPERLKGRTVTVAVTLTSGQRVDGEFTL